MIVLEWRSRPSGAPTLTVEMTEAEAWAIAHGETAAFVAMYCRWWEFCGKGSKKEETDA